MKSKWYFLKCSKELMDIKDALSSYDFESDGDRGFRIEYGVSDVIKGRYIEKVVDNEIFNDPYGAESQVELIRYLNINFLIHKDELGRGRYLLEIVDPPRSIKCFIQLISELLDRITVEVINIRILDFYKTIYNESPRAKIVRIKASGINISTNSQMKVDIVSSGDALGDCISFFGVDKFNLEKIKIEKPFKGFESAIEVTNKGGFVFGEDLVTVGRIYIRNFIINSYKNLG